jgi:hypothetical protein
MPLKEFFEMVDLAIWIVSFHLRIGFSCSARRYGLVVWLALEGGASARPTASDNIWREPSELARSGHSSRLGIRGRTDSDVCS